MIVIIECIGRSICPAGFDSRRGAGSSSWIWSSDIQAVDFAGLMPFAFHPGDGVSFGPRRRRRRKDILWSWPAPKGLHGRAIAEPLFLKDPSFLNRSIDIFPGFDYAFNGGRGGSEWSAMSGSGEGVDLPVAQEVAHAGHASSYSADFA